MGSYWDGVRRRAMTRRRLLAGAAAGAAGAGAIGLVGCGDGGGETTTTRSTGSAGQPRRGGHLYEVMNPPPTHFDPVLNSGVGTIAPISPVYSRLWRPKIGAGLDPWDWPLDPDLSDKLEQPDRTTYVYHVRQGAKWQDRPPLNGRDFVADDVVYSVRRALDHPQSAIKGELADIDTVRAIDARTVEVKTKEPVSPFGAKFGGGNYVWMLPHELVEQKGDLREVAVGTGPFIMDSYTPNVSVEYSRNPNYFGSPQPYADKMTGTIIVDPNGIEAAFTTGKVDTHSVGDRRAFDRLARAVPDVLSVANDTPGHRFAMRSDRPPFQDVRVRQAFALTVDYQGLIQAFSGGEGVIDTLVPQAMKAWAVPQSQWGDGTKYHSKPDLSEAKKLLEAAGYGNGVDFDFYYATSFAQQNSTESILQAVSSAAEKVGFKARLRPEEYAVYIQRNQGKSEYSGMLHRPTGKFQDPDDYTFTYLHPKGRTFSTFHKDPDLDALLIKQRQEFDVEARKQILAQIERRNLVQNYYMPTFSFRAYNVWHKRLQNYSPRPDLGFTWAIAAWLQE